MAKDKDTINRVISGTLLIGIWTTTICFSLGLVLQFLKGSINASNYYLSIFLNPDSYFFLGTLALIMTPVMRVLVSIILFFRAKESKYAAITILVAIILLVSFGLSIAFDLKIG